MHDLYAEEIIDHDRYPRNKGNMENPETLKMRKFSIKKKIKIPANSVNSKYLIILNFFYCYLSLIFFRYFNFNEKSGKIKNILF